MTDRTRQLQLFGPQVDPEGFHERVRQQMSRAERSYTRAWVQAVVDVFTAPIRAGRHESHSLASKFKDDIVLERLVRLIKVSQQHREIFEEAEADGRERDEVYRELRGDWKDVGQRLTNWEVCVNMCEASLEAPLSYDAVAEYQRAFAHCYGVEVYQHIFGTEPISLERCKMVRYAVGFSKLPALDDAERAWVAAFNVALKSYEAAEVLFGHPVKVSKTASSES